MTGSLALGDILHVEDTTELLAPRCRRTGIPLWATVRFLFLRSIIGDLLFGTSIVSRPPPPRRLAAAAGKVLTLANAVTRNTAWMLSRRGDYPVVLMATGARMVRRDGRFFNCLSDHFAGALPGRSVVIESLFDWRWTFPRWHRDTLVHTPRLVRSDLVGKRGAAAFSGDAAAVVDLAAARAKALLGWEIGDERRAWLTLHAARGAASLPSRYEGYKALLRRLGARVLIKEEACYGGADNAALMLAARHLGLRTAEYQHGLISAGHDSYNFAPAVRTSPEYAQILPEHLLTYGSWWSEQVNVPVRKVAIGNPHRSQILQPVPPAGPRKAVLVLGDGYDTDFYLGLCEALASSLAGTCDVVFRPHPLERAAVVSRGLEALEGRVRLDTTPDIYDAFARADVLVSEMSTGLFEAIGLVPRIFLWDTPKARFSLPSHPFATFSSPQDLATLVREPGAGTMLPADAERFWATGWSENYTRFLEGALQ